MELSQKNNEEDIFKAHTEQFRGENYLKKKSDEVIYMINLYYKKYVINKDNDLWVFSFGMPVFVCLVIGYNFKVSRKAAWLTIIITYVIDCIWTFVDMSSVLPGVWSMNLYMVMVVSVVLGIVLHLIIPGEPAWKKRHAEEIERNSQPAVD